MNISVANDSLEGCLWDRAFPGDSTGSFIGNPTGASTGSSEEAATRSSVRASTEAFVRASTWASTEARIGSLKGAAIRSFCRSLCVSFYDFSLWIPSMNLRMLLWELRWSAPISSAYESNRRTEFMGWVNESNQWDESMSPINASIGWLNNLFPLVRRGQQMASTNQSLEVSAWASNNFSREAAPAERAKRAATTRRMNLERKVQSNFS